MKKIFFRADAGPQIGYGHFIRSLALADMLKDDFDCFFFTTNPTDYQIKEIEKICAPISLKENSGIDDFIDFIAGDEIVVLDNYFFTTENQKAIKDRGCKLVCIDDMHDKHYIADIVINHGIDNPHLLNVEPYTRLCIGLDWALLRKPFLELSEIKRIRGNLFLSFGGADFNNLTRKYLPILASIDGIDKISVVIGDGCILEEPIFDSYKINFYKNLSAEQMASLMQESEYALLPTSGVCMEALACGCKVLGGYYVDNQKEFYRYLKTNKIIYPLGNLNNVNGTFIDAFHNVKQFILPKKLRTEKIRTRYISIFKQL